MSAQDTATLNVNPGYDDEWLTRYENLSGVDAQIANSEMEVVEAALQSSFASWHRPALTHLDLGTCTGRYLRWSRHRGFGRSVGVDAAPAAIRFCSRSIAEPERIVIEQADFLRPGVLASLGERYDGFDLVTIMMGTINHVAGRDQPGLLDAIGRVLRVSGRLILSSWRPGREVLSLYTEAECQQLSGTPLQAGLLTGEAAACGLRLFRLVSTPWQDIAEFGLLHR